MTAELIERIAAQGVFRPRTLFTQLAADHFPFDRLTGQDLYETAATAALLNVQPVGVIGDRGVGKSSLIAHVCAHLELAEVLEDPDRFDLAEADALLEARSWRWRRPSLTGGWYGCLTGWRMALSAMTFNPGRSHCSNIASLPTLWR